MLVGPSGNTRNELGAQNSLHNMYHIDVDADLEIVLLLECRDIIVSGGSVFWNTGPKQAGFLILAFYIS